MNESRGNGICAMVQIFSFWAEAIHHHRSTEYEFGICVIVYESQTVHLNCVPLQLYMLILLHISTQAACFCINLSTEALLENNTVEFFAIINEAHVKCGGNL